MYTVHTVPPPPPPHIRLLFPLQVLSQSSSLAEWPGYREPQKHSSLEYIQMFPPSLLAGRKGNIETKVCNLCRISNICIISIPNYFVKNMLCNIWTEMATFDIDDATKRKRNLKFWHLQEVLSCIFIMVRGNINKTDIMYYVPYTAYSRITFS